MIKKLFLVIGVALSLAMCVVIFQIASAGRFGAQILIVNESDSDVPIHARQVLPLQTLDERHLAPKNGGHCDLEFLFTRDEVPSDILIMTADDKVIGRYHIGEAQDMTYHLTIPREGRKEAEPVK